MYMGRKLLRILRHSVTMVGRNLRSYSMLSVTIVISFSAIRVSGIDGLYTLQQV